MALFSLTVGAWDNSAEDRFDARELGRLEAWVRKHHWRGSTDKVSFSGGTLTLESQEGGVSVRIIAVAQDVERMMKGFKLAAKHQNELKFLRIIRHVKLADRFHNSVGFKPVLTMRFDAQEVLKYNFDNTVVFSLLDAARVEFAHPAIGDVKRKYCNSDSGQFSRGFCRG